MFEDCMAISSEVKVNFLSDQCVVLCF